MKSKPQAVNAQMATLRDRVLNDMAELTGLSATVAIGTTRTRVMGATTTSAAKGFGSVQLASGLSKGG